MNEFDTTVAELMDEFGTVVTIMQAGTTGYDPATGNVTAIPKTITTKAYLTDLTLQSNGLSVKYGTLVQTGDKELFMLPPQKYSGSPAPITLVPGVDTVKVGGTVYSIVTLKEVNPTGSDAILYTLYLRR